MLVGLDIACKKLAKHGLGGYGGMQYQKCRLCIEGGQDRPLGETIGGRDPGGSGQPVDYTHGALTEKGGQPGQQGSRDTNGYINNG